MNLEDLARKTIDELNTQMSSDESKEPQKELNEATKDLQEDVSEPEELAFNPYEQEFKLSSDKEDEEQNELFATSAEPQNTELADKEELSFNDEFFLKNIKERILVLFEGLKATKKENLEDRLDLTINFLKKQIALKSNRRLN